MSGELVISPIVLPVAILGGAVLLTGSVAAVAVVGIKALIEQRIEAGRLEAEKEKARIAAWQRYHQIQFDAMQASRQEFDHILLAVNRLAAHSISTPIEAPTTVRAPQGFIASSSNRSVDQLHAVLEEISAVLNQLPTSLSSLGAFGGISHRNEQLWRRVNLKDFPALEEIESLRQTLTKTLTRHQEQLAIREQERQKGLTRLNGLLDQVLMYERLAVDRQHQKDLFGIKAHFLHLLDADEVNPHMISTLESALEDIALAIDTGITQQAVCPALAKAITRHLGEMDYQWLKGLELDTTTQSYSGRVLIPGGEQICIKMHRNGEFAFKLVHEESDDEVEFDVQALDYLRAQEARWCSDANELLRRLAGDGFGYQVRLARDIPEERIEIVRIEGVDEILEAEERQRREQNQPSGRTIG